MKYDEETDIDHDDAFYFIAGYTSSGFPYGVTWEQLDKDGILEERILYVEITRQ